VRFDGVTILYRYNIQLFNFNDFGKINWIKAVQRKDLITQKVYFGDQTTQVNKIFDHTFITYKDIDTTIMLFVDSEGNVQEKMINNLSSGNKFILYPNQVKKIGNHTFRGHLYYKGYRPHKGRKKKYIILEIKEKNNKESK
ncbi:hypothetical protein, partial [Flammeovirga sp. OC4]|uniref:hypothetical protein n=1 Tax=Flammeovirga sp. OC4 TaxID=1382345 RepID=UPI0005C6AF12